MYEGFIAYVGRSSKEIEVMAVGLREMVDPDIASSSADSIAYFVNQMVPRGIPAVTPPGGLEFYHEPPVLRFLTGKLRPPNDWGKRLADAFAAKFGENC